MSCTHKRIADVTGKCSDMFNATVNGIEYSDYVPDDMGIGGGDYMRFSYCLDCGQIQGDFPLPETEIERNANEEDDDD